MDRRWSTRKPVQINVTLEVPGHTGPVKGSLRDLSLSGAFVETNFLLPYAPLVIAFQLPGSLLQDGFRLETRMVRRTVAGAGLLFLSTSTSVIRALSEALPNLETLSKYRERG